MKEQIHNQEIEDPWEAWNKAFESNEHLKKELEAWNKALESDEHFKKEVLPGLTFMCNELESDTIEK